MPKDSALTITELWKAGSLIAITFHFTDASYHSHKPVAMACIAALKINLT